MHNSDDTECNLYIIVDSFHCQHIDLTDAYFLIFTLWMATFPLCNDFTWIFLDTVQVYWKQDLGTK